MDGKAGMAGAAAWGFAEAVSWPVTMEMYLAVVGVANPRRILPAAAWLTAGSVAGVLVTSELTRRGLRPPAPLTTATMRDAAAQHMAAGARGVWKQAANGVPVKLYAAAAGEAGIPRIPLAVHTAGARGARAVAMGAAIGGAAVGRAPGAAPVLRAVPGRARRDLRGRARAGDPLLAAQGRRADRRAVAA